MIPAQVLEQKNRPFYLLCKMSALVRDAASPPASTTGGASSAASSNGATSTSGSGSGASAAAGAAPRPLPDPILDRLETCVADLGGCIGGCERILSTPIPLSYTRHTSRSIVLWLATLPFALWEPMGWAMLPAIFLISYIFLGIDEIGVEIEEPFCILPLFPLCQVIHRDVGVALGLNQQQQPATA